ncbi:phosphatidylcholine and lysophosphatidylcholine phospholipase [Mucor velutinosus]|uniref:Phosphatidylcholine and lysophosphatidylcholine phospholipase n=1 Tax=Mucor velutinosus TaxID=708070 RepID=A0AAN7HUV0_9FUNG|nr:phosphatidylcholine and lysophosphatidylcholine phospholipase [Mucor velutinosus]
MGQSKSRENNALSKTTHFSTKEIDNLRQNVKTQDQNNITADVFKDSVKQCMPTVSMTDDAFLQRLYCAFGGDEEKEQCLDFSKFVDGLSVFMKGTPEEKLKLSFKLYDVDKDGFISKDELEHVMLQLSKMMANEDKQDEEIQRSIDCMFEDFDVDCDGKLSFDEYKLSAMKEPLIADFLERFLDQHNLSNNPSPTSRPTSVRSRQSSRSLNNNTNNANTQQNRLSFRLSQAELLDYSHQQQKLALSDSPNMTPSSATPSPRTSVYLPLTSATTAALTPKSNSPVSSSSTSSNTTTQTRPNLPNRLSRGPSMASLDAAMTSI